MNRPKVLVVDDNRDAAWSTGELLARFGCVVRVCYDGPTALTEAAEFRPDVCVLDLGMPGMDGLELAGRLQGQADRLTRYIALTGRWDIVSSHQTHNAGFERHLVKPVDPHALADAVSTPLIAAA